nr:FAD-dependent oxidoreductase [Bradyrhizobium sp. 141]
MEARHIVIATGSKPRPLPIPGAEHLITSDDMLRDLDLPASVIFVGGGVISLEFSHVYARAGADVTILDVLPQLLPAMDTDAVARLQTESERRDQDQYRCQRPTHRARRRTVSRDLHP